MPSFSLFYFYLFSLRFGKTSLVGPEGKVPGRLVQPFCPGTKRLGFYSHWLSAA